MSAGNSLPQAFPGPANLTESVTRFAGAASEIHSLACKDGF
jgi:hypothetical protein